MQNENAEERNNVMVLNLRDLFFYLLSKWAYILAALVIGGILGGLLSFVQMKKSTVLSPEEIVENLDESKINKEQVKQYADFMSLYNQQVEYEENSYLQSLNPNEVWTARYAYYISGDENCIGEAKSRFLNLLDADGRKAELLKVGGTDCSEQAFGELFNIQFNVNALIPVSEKQSGDVTGKNATLVVEFMHSDEQVCKRVADSLEKLIMEEADEIASIYSDFAIEDVGTRIVFERNETVAEKQFESVNLRKTYLTEASAIKGKLSDDELTFYKYQYEEELPEGQSEAGFSKKKLLLGAVAAVFILAMAFCVIYLLNGRVKSKDDVSVVYGLPILAYLNNGKQRKGLSGLISKWKNGKLAASNDADYLVSVLSTKELSKCLLIADLSDDAQKRIADEILSKDDRFECKGLLGKQSEAISVLQQCDGAVLMLELWKTKKAEIERELEILKHMGKEVLGTVIIKSE